MGNVSHIVHSFTFGNGDAQGGIHKIVSSLLPKEYRQHGDPLAGRSFTVPRFHQAPHHYVKVVHTRFTSSGIRSYQQTHQWSVRQVARKTVPQAKFSYDLAPVEVLVSSSDRKWYDYVTSIFAIIGGAFTFMSMTSGVVGMASAHFKGSINKLG